MTANVPKCFLDFLKVKEVPGSLIHTLATHSVPLINRADEKHVLCPAGDIMKRYYTTPELS